MTQNEVAKLKKQLLIERSIFLFILVAALGTWLYVANSHPKYCISVDGKSIVCLQSRELAESIIEKAKTKAQLSASEISFREAVEIIKAPKSARLTNGKNAQEIFEKAVTLKTEKWVVLSNGTPVVAFAAQKDAGDFLNQLKMKYGQMAKSLSEEPQFKENVTIDEVGVDPMLYKKSVAEAIDFFFSGRPSVPSANVYTVKSGDVAGKIARKNGLKISELAALNPKTNLHKLAIGDKLKLKASTTAKKDIPTLTVVVRDQNERVEKIAPEIIRVSSAQMYIGKQYLISPGRAGKRRIKEAIIYENGVKKSSEIIEEEILVKPKPKQIAEGIKSR